MENETFWELVRFAKFSKPQEPAPQALEALLESKCLPDEIRNLLPIIYQNIYTTGIAESAPEALLTQLQQQTLRTISSVQVNKAWLKRFAKKLSHIGESAILLKGAAFNGWLYSDNAPRGAVDVDILVKPTAFDSVCNLMLNTHEAHVADEKRMVTHAQLFERAFLPKHTLSPVVEVHKNLTNPYIFNIPVEKLWETTIAHPGMGEPQLRVLSPEHNILNLVVHAVRDGTFDSHSLIDAYELITQQEINWDYLEREAELWGCSKALVVFFTRLHQRLQTSPPPLLGTTELATLKQSTKFNSPNHSRIEQLRWQFKMADRKSSVLRFHLDYLRMRMGDFLLSKKAFFR